LLLHDYLTERGIREHCQITLVMPFELPIPPSPESSKALLRAFAERNIQYMPNLMVEAFDPNRNILTLLDESEIPCDLFMCIPKHRVPQVVEESGMTKNGWIPVDPATLKTSYPGVYALGDVAQVGTPKAGVFAEGAARVAAKSIMAELKGHNQPPAYDGIGTCYIEFGGQQVARVEVNFLSAPKPTGYFEEPSPSLAEEKDEFAAERYSRWFNR
jgi:sulfide:quinone oxidoreductase